MVASSPYYAQMPPPGAMNIRSSHMASPAVIPGTATSGRLTRDSTQKETIEDVGVGIADFGTQLGIGAGAALGAGAAGAGSVISAVGSRIKGNREIEMLVKEFTPTIAQQLGIPPEQVDEKALRSAAFKFKENEGLRDALKTIDQRNSASPIRSAISGAASLGAMALGPAGIVGSMAVGAATDYAVGKAMDSTLGNVEHEGEYSQLRNMEEKLSAKQPITQEDMFAFHLSSNRMHAEQIKGKMGGDFKDLTPEKQQKILKDNPELAAQCRYEAEQLNNGSVKPISLMDTRQRSALMQSFMEQPPQTQLAPDREYAGRMNGAAQTLDTEQPGAFTRQISQEMADANTLPPNAR